MVKKFVLLNLLKLYIYEHFDKVDHEETITKRLFAISYLEFYIYVIIGLFDLHKFFFFGKQLE